MLSLHSHRRPSERDASQGSSGNNEEIPQPTPVMALALASSSPSGDASTQLATTSSREKTRQRSSKQNATTQQSSCSTAGLLDRLCGRKRGRDIHEVDSGEATVHDRHVTMMTAREENRPTRPSLRKTPRQNDDHLLYQCDLGVHIQVVEADRTGNEHSYVGMVVTRYDGATVALQLEDGQVRILPTLLHRISAVNLL